LGHLLWVSSAEGALAGALAGVLAGAFGWRTGWRDGWRAGRRGLLLKQLEWKILRADFWSPPPSPESCACNKKYNYALHDILCLYLHFYPLD
jgi:hypothetical protein